MGQPLAPIGHSFAYAQRFISAWAITFAALVANPPLQAINPEIDVKKSPMTAMGVYALLGHLSVMASGILNGNVYRILESLISTPHTFVSLLNGQHHNASPNISSASINTIFSVVTSEDGFPQLTWPRTSQTLPAFDETPSFFTPMQCMDIIEGIRTLSEIDPLNPDTAQESIDQAYTKFENHDKNNHLSIIKDPKEAFLLFCQAHAPYYSERPFLRAVQSLGDIKRNPLAVAQILGIFSEIFGVIAGLQTSSAGQNHPLESLDSAINVALRCLVILGSMKNVADAVGKMQAYIKKDQKDNPLLKPFNVVLDNANRIDAFFSLMLDLPTEGLDALLAALGPEHDGFKLLTVLFYSIDSIIRFDLDKDTTPSQAQAGESNVPVPAVTTEAFFEGLNHQNPLEAFSQWLRLMQSGDASARDS